MFKFPTSRLFSTLKSALRPAMPRFKVSATWLLTLAWIFLLVWIWWQGPKWTLYEQHWLAPLANRWLATAVWGLIALVWLTWRVMKRLQKLEKQQKEEARFLRSLLELDGTTRINAELAEGLIESMYLYGDGRLEINFGFKGAVEHE